MKDNLLKRIIREFYLSAGEVRRIWNIDGDAQDPR